MKRLYKIGLLAQDTSQGIKTLARVVTVGKYSSFQIPIGTDYTVPAGKKFIITEIMAQTDSAGGQLKILYGDNSVSDSVTPPINPVYQTTIIELKEAVTIYKIELYFEVPEGKLPCLYSFIGTVRCNISGLEI